jgi:hypothetical protein
VNYKQAMKWSRKHPKGTKQPVIMSTNSGFWPSRGTIESYQCYADACQKIDAQPLPIKEHYDLSCRGQALSILDHHEAAEWTKARGTQ